MSVHEIEESVQNRKYMKGDDCTEPLCIKMTVTIAADRMAAFNVNRGESSMGRVSQDRGRGKQVTIVPANAI